MLKKLVRYGNSNALVLDKAILELLNIAEGSIVKIKTDGHSIIITPHQENSTEKVSETLVSDDAMRIVGIRETMKAYKNLSEAQKTALEKEWLALNHKHIELYMQLGANEEYQKEALALKNMCGQNSVQLVEEHEKLTKKYIPELASVREAMTNFDAKCRELSGEKPVANVAEINELMQKDFAEVFSKHKDIQMACGMIMISPEYQHRAQLLTEKFQGNQNSAEFIQEMKQLMYEFCPDMEQVHKEVEAVSKKYAHLIPV